jgi:S-adenosylmethionine-diacylglycerol 3-amino-3-carboxypropyl transferase
MSGAEVAGKAAFTGIRYAQCWEDADILLDGLNVQPGDVCVSIASAGDNSLALLTKDPARVLAVDLSAAQLACLDLRCAAYQALGHRDYLELYGARPSTRRDDLYAACRPHFREAASRDFWDARRNDLASQGFAAMGKFERYFRIFANWILPFVHPRRRVAELLRPKSMAERRQFYDAQWNTPRWRALFGIFFSRTVMGALGRDPRFFDYVEGDLKTHLMARVAHAAVELDPAANPYLHWIMNGTFGDALPVALRAENYDLIRARIDRIEWRQAAVEDVIGELTAQGTRPARYNLSDIFEYMSAENTEALLAKLAAAGAKGGRLAYWNMMVPRSRPESLAGKLKPLDPLARDLFLKDKAFFYRAFVVEEIR